MTSLEHRDELVTLINDAIGQGARREAACDVVGISRRTLLRWVEDGEVLADQRPVVPKHCAYALTDAEKQQIIDVCNSSEMESLPPSQIVPILADRGVYIASERSFYRVLKQFNQNHERGLSRPRQERAAPTTYEATAPCQVFSWDITYLKGPAKGVFFYLYLIMDIYSRKAVGYEVYEQESGEYASELIERTCWKEKTINKPLVLHSDNGSPMKASTMAAKLVDLGITASHSRPRVSNDNPYSEALFRTCKYRPDFPREGFESLTQAREWVAKFVDWYNNVHRHSGIKFVTPSERHNGEDKVILQRRSELYEKAKRENPKRWSGDVRDWEMIDTVSLNPEKECA